MHKNVFLASALAFGAVTGTAPLLAQLPVARPAAIVSTTLRGGGGFNTLGIPFTREPVVRDVVAGSAGNTITGTGGGYGDFASTPHSVLILTGPNRGTALRIASNTTNSVTLASPVPGLVNNSDEFYVVPEWTLATFFGATVNPSGLTSNGNPNLADIVYIDDGNGNLVQYFHNGTNWRRVVGSPANQNNTSLGGFGGGTVILKRSAGDLVFNVQGTLRSGRQIEPVPPGLSVVTFTEAGGATLGTSGLVPGILASNGNPNLADIVSIPDGSGSLVQYFHNGTNWRRVVGSPANQNGLPIRPETALVINKRSAGTAQYVVDEQYVAGP